MNRSIASSCPREPKAANRASVPAAIAMPANDMKSQSSPAYGAFMLRSPTATRSRMPVRSEGTKGSEQGERASRDRDARERHEEPELASVRSVHVKEPDRDQEQDAGQDRHGD